MFCRNYATRLFLLVVFCTCQATGGETSPPADWPSFPEDVVRAGKGLIVPAPAGGQARGRSVVPQFPPKVDYVATLLESANFQKQRSGIYAVRDNEFAELIPRCIPLLDSPDFEVRDGAAETIIEFGVPELTPENAPRFLGYSAKLDRHIAAYLRAKYGCDALPVVRRVVSKVLDDGAAHRPSVAGPPFGFIEQGAGLSPDEAERFVIELVKSAESENDAYAHIQLLSQVEGKASAELVGHFLRHENGFYRQHAIQVARNRKLTQYADDLLRIVNEPLVTEEYSRWLKFRDDYTFEESQRIRGKYSARPMCAKLAIEALLAFKDPRAWEPALQLLDGNALNAKAHGLGFMPHTSIAFGTLLAGYKNEKRDEIHRVLLEEIGGTNRRWKVAALAAALALDPDTADEEVLWELALSPRLPLIRDTGDSSLPWNPESPPAEESPGRLLAAVALSRLGDRNVVPILRDLAKLSRARDVSGYYRGAPYEFIFITKMNSGYREDLYGLRRTALIRVTSPDGILDCGLRRDHIDLIAALRRLGEDTSSEKQAELLQDRGKLGGRIDKMIDLGNPAPLSRIDQVQLRYEIPHIIEQRLTQYSDHLVAAFAQPDFDPRSCYRTSILDALCRLGDKRGLDLAATNPLLLLEVAKYIADAPDTTAAYPAFKYNRVQDGLKLVRWYREHGDKLTWDADSGAFRIAHPSD